MRPGQCQTEPGARASIPGRLQTPLTLPPPVPDFPEAAALTQPVQALLLDQFQDLRLDLLSKLPVGTATVR